MNFYSKRYKVTKILKATKALGFDSIRVGDHIKCILNLKGTRGASSGGLYALYITIIHEETNTIWKNSQNQFTKNIKNFILEED